MSSNLCFSQTRGVSRGSLGQLKRCKAMVPQIVSKAQISHTQIFDRPHTVAGIVAVLM